MMARLIPMAVLSIVALLCDYACAVQEPASKSATTAKAPAEKTVGAASGESKGEVGGGKEAASPETKEHGAAEHHDPYDNGHANLSRSVINPVEIKADSAIFTFLVFLLILFVLTKFAWKPIAHGLELREKGIEEKIEQARIAAEQATEQLKQYEAKLAAATVEAQQLVAKARQDAEAAREKIVAEANAAAQKERDRAVADIGTAKNQALREIAERAVDTAISLARNIIRREVRPGDHEQLIRDALKQFPNGNSLN